MTKQKQIKKNLTISPVFKVHRLPADLRKTLTTTPASWAAWENSTPLARNEWICWVESAKKPETRSRRIERTQMELIDGKRRPCCWAGCPHRPNTRQLLR